MPPEARAVTLAACAAVMFRKPAPVALDCTAVIPDVVTSFAAASARISPVPAPASIRAPTAVVAAVVTVSLPAPPLNEVTPVPSVVLIPPAVKPLPSIDVACVAVKLTVVPAPEATTFVNAVSVIVPKVRLVAALILMLDTLFERVKPPRVLTCPPDEDCAPPEELIVLDVTKVGEVKLKAPPLTPPVTERAPAVVADEAYVAVKVPC